MRQTILQLRLLSKIILRISRDCLGMFVKWVTRCKYTCPGTCEGLLRRSAILIVWFPYTALADLFCYAHRRIQDFPGDGTSKMLLSRSVTDSCNYSFSFRSLAPFAKSWICTLLEGSFQIWNFSWRALDFRT